MTACLMALISKGKKHQKQTNLPTSDDLSLRIRHQKGIFRPDVHHSTDILLVF